MTTTDRTPTDRLTAKGVRTRNQLIAAARTIFERDGFVAARVTDIADLAGVAHGTFYSYFDSKEEVFHDLIRLASEEMLTGTVNGATGPEAAEVDDAPWAQVARANRRYLAAYRNNSRLMIVWEKATSEDAQRMRHEARQMFTRRSARMIVRLQEQGIADAEIDPYYAAVALGAMVSRFAYNWFSGNEDFDFDRAVDQLTRIWCNALGIPPGAARA